MSGVRIQPYEAEDAEEVARAVTESVREVGEWLPWCHAGYSADDAREWIRLQQELQRLGRAYAFAIRDDAGRYLGGCGVNQVDPVNRFGNLGYWVRTSAMGQGVAPAAVRLVADRVFGETNLVRLEIVCAVGNTRSMRVAEKAGALREAVLRQRLTVPGGVSDAVMYSLVREREPRS